MSGQTIALALTWMVAAGNVALGVVGVDVVDAIVVIVGLLVWLEGLRFAAVDVGGVWEGTKFNHTLHIVLEHV